MIISDDGLLFEQSHMAGRGSRSRCVSQIFACVGVESARVEPNTSGIWNVATQQGECVEAFCSRGICPTGISAWQRSHRLHFLLRNPAHNAGTYTNMRLLTVCENNKHISGRPSHALRLVDTVTHTHARTVHFC